MHTHLFMSLISGKLSSVNQIPGFSDYFFPFREKTPFSAQNRAVPPVSRRFSAIY
jgi:hypothetical protein